MEGGPSIQVEHESQEEIDIPSLENESRGCCFTLCDPRGKGHRFIALLFMCFLGFGSYYCYDSPASLQNEFERDLNITVNQFVIFYSVYSWPNVVLCFVGGFLIDRFFGIRWGTIIFMIFTLVGQALFALGGFLNLYWIMIAGRFIFGVGGESLAVAQNNYAVLWFQGKELNMVFGLLLSFSRIGSAVNFWSVAPLYAWVSSFYEGHEALGITLFIVTLTCLLSMICAIILGILDKRVEVICRRRETDTGEVVRLSDMKHFGASFWLIGVICVAYYVAIFPFISVGQNFFVTRFHMTPQAANTVNSIVYLISAVASPVLGIFIDKCGKNMSVIIVAIAGTLGSHALLGFTYANPYIGMTIMGICYSMLAAGLWPLVALIIPSHQLGTAYGVCQSIQNLGLAVINIIVGQIISKGGYFWLEIFFIACLIFAFIVGILLLFVNNCTGGILNMTPGQREEKLRSLQASEILEREKLLSESVTPSVNEDTRIRNRYLSRIGAKEN